MIAIWFTFTPKGMVINNSTVYFNVSPLILIISSLITYLIAGVICRITGRKRPEKIYFDVIIEKSSKQAKIKGKVDTGCNLVEPFSGSPVIVCNKNLVKNIVPENILEYDKYNVNTSQIENIRVIPFRTISGNGLLPCFKPDKVFIGDNLCLNEIYVALADKDSINGEFACLINPLCLD